MKEYALNYTNSLPNYMCIQTTRRQIEPTERDTCPYGDVIQEELSFFDQKESYKVEMSNRAIGGEHGAQSTGRRGVVGRIRNHAAHIFDPDTGTEFDWDHWATLRGRRMYVFSFRVPKSAGYSMYHGESKREYTSAYKGLIYADRDTKAVMRIKMDCVGIPTDYPIQEVGITLDYAPTKIGDQEFVLPFHFELNSTDPRRSSRTKRITNCTASSARSRRSLSATPSPDDQLKSSRLSDDKAKPPVKKQNNRSTLETPFSR